MKIRDATGEYTIVQSHLRRVRSNRNNYNQLAMFLLIMIGGGFGMWLLSKYWIAIGILALLTLAVYILVNRKKIIRNRLQSSVDKAEEEHQQTIREQRNKKRLEELKGKKIEWL